MRLLHALLLAALSGGGGGVRAFDITDSCSLSTEYGSNNGSNKDVVYKLTEGNSASIAGDMVTNTTISITTALSVTINELVSSDVDRLYIRTGTDAAMDYGNIHAMVTINSTTFSSLTGLTALSLQNLNFTQTNLTLSIPDTVAYLQVEYTNAVEVSLTVSNSSLNQVDFGYNVFSKVPKCLYEREYANSITVSSLDISGNETTQLTAEQYNMLKNNVQKLSSGFFEFGESCSSPASTSSSSSGSGNSAVVATTTTPTATTATPSSTTTAPPSSSSTSSSNGSGTVNAPSPTETLLPSDNNRTRNLASSSTAFKVCIVVDSSSGTASNATSSGNNNQGSSAADANTTSTHKSSSKSWIYILVAICAMVLVAAAFVLQRKRKNTRKGNQLSTLGTSSLDDSIDGASVNLIGKDEGTPAAGKLSFISGDDWLRNVRLEPSDVSLNKPIGSGRLFTGSYQSNKVIIKRAEAAVTETAVTKQLMAQAQLLAQLSHPNLIKLVGVAWVAGTDFAIVTEFVPKGNLRAVLTKSKADLTMRMKINMCIDIAQALAYLHSADRSMYVQNLSTSKVLVADDLLCKVNLLACQSCATPLVSKHNSVSDSYGTGDIAWLAPEIITRSAPLNPRAVNVYAFGVLMCELFGDALPYQSLINEMGNTLSDVEIVKRIRRQQVVVPHENSLAYMNAPVKVRDMIDGCLSSTPHSRPSADDIAKCLMAIHLDDDVVERTTTSL